MASSSSLKVTYQLLWSAYSQWTGLLGQFSLLNISLTELSELFGSISLRIKMDRLLAGGGGGGNGGGGGCDGIVFSSAIFKLLLQLLALRLQLLLSNVAERSLAASGFVLRCSASSIIE